MKIDEQKIFTIVDEIEILIEKYYLEVNQINTENPIETKNENHRYSYLSLLIKVLDAFIKDIPLKEVSDEIQTQYLKVCHYLKNNEFNSEEIRKALLFLWVTAFKNTDLPLDLITPDSVGLIIANLLQGPFKDEKKIRMIDPNLGTGNLVSVINNYSPQSFSITGIDSYGAFCKLANVCGNLMGLDLQVYFQDALQFSYNDFDCLVCDTAIYDVEKVASESVLYQKGIRYFPYLLIENFISCDKIIKYQFYVVDSDFFEHDIDNAFRLFLLEHARIAQIIVLPSTMFQKGAKMKQILVIKPKESGDNNSTAINLLPSLYQKEELFAAIQEIKANITK